MALEAASGYLATAEELLVENIAASDVWQDLTGAIDATAAKANIYFDALPAPDDGAEEYLPAEYEAFLPAAIVYTAETSGLIVYSAGVGARVSAGVIHCQFDLRVPDSISKSAGVWVSDRKSAVLRWGKNRISKLISDVSPLNGITDFNHQAGYLTINQVEVAYLAMMDDSEAQSLGFDVFQFALQIQWGVSQ